MIIVLSERCPKDHFCPLVKMCPQKAIDQKDYNAPTIDNDKCIECLICVENCPNKAVVFE